MVKIARQNADKDKNHAQYSDSIRFSATYVFLLGGRSAYEFLNSNLPLPSTKTIRKFLLFFIRYLIPYLIHKLIPYYYNTIILVRCINENKCRVVEGQLRCVELNDYLEKMKTEKSVLLSEDGTVIISKITYFNLFLFIYLWQMFT